MNQIYRPILQIWVPVLYLLDERFSRGPSPLNKYNLPLHQANSAAFLGRSRVQPHGRTMLRLVPQTKMSVRVTQKRRHNTTLLHKESMHEVHSFHPSYLYDHYKPYVPRCRYLEGQRVNPASALLLGGSPSTLG